MAYIGKSIRELRRRVLEHIGDIENKRDTPVAKHMLGMHPKNPLCIKFCVVEMIKSKGRRGDVDKLLQQKETEWIYRMKTMSPSGLNDILSYKPFL